jgi:hypothetical protein
MALKLVAVKYLLLTFALGFAKGAISAHKPASTLPTCPNTWGKVIVRNGKYVINFTSLGEERYCEVCSSGRL